ncbi:hypothetical protein GCM10023153_11030 [Ornithinibacter aureus]|uniref:Uncharacterized protein n=1 Tax=Ornithinibacter aureus TaxID=622664 RepID=A0ABP8JKJ6_9MICO
MATTAICDPTLDSVNPAYRRRYAAFSRNGVRSGRWERSTGRSCPTGVCGWRTGTSHRNLQLDTTKEVGRT